MIQICCSTQWIYTIRIRFPGGAGVFLFAATSRPVLGTLQALIQWLPGTLSSKGEATGALSCHSPPLHFEIKKGQTTFTSVPLDVLVTCRLSHRDRFPSPHTFMITFLSKFPCVNASAMKQIYWSSIRTHTRQWT